MSRRRKQSWKAGFLCEPKPSKQRKADAAKKVHAILDQISKEKGAVDVESN
jgi:hypothetical protein